MNYTPKADSLAPIKAWGPDHLRPADIQFRFSGAAEAELLAVLGKVALFDLDALDVTEVALAAVRAEIEALRYKVERACGFVLLEPITGLDDPEQRRALSWVIAQLLGEPVVQNEAGDRVVSVYDRDRTKRMRDGARYHQTREGGSLHTDNVNVLERWDYLMMTCVVPAMTGGESLLVSGQSVYNVLKHTAPEAVDILCEDFWWECRGISDAVFRAPIITFNAWDEPEFRYLRPYLTSAHERAGEPLTEAQLWAIDTLDSVLEASALQFRHKLDSGQVLVINDNQIFHGRTCFSDHFDGVTYGPALRAKDKRFNRFFDRSWIRTQGDAAGE